MKRIPEDMTTGTRHMTNTCGELEIIEYHKKKHVLVKFTVTGYECVVQSNNIRAGAVKDKMLPVVCGVGYIGVGKYSPPRTPKIYQIWTGMLTRCYSEREQRRRPTYSDCSVAPIWHNLQAFGEWYEANYPRDGRVYQLDKDIKVDGNRVYSPETCMFVTQAENTEASCAKFYTFLSPDKKVCGVYNLMKFCRDNRLNQSAMTRVVSGKAPHHKGWTKA